VTATTEQAAIDLMPQLRDILHLPEDLDLPKLYRVTMTAYDDEPGWRVSAMLSGTNKTDLELWDGLRAWALGAMPDLSKPSASSHTQSGMYRKASVSVSVADVSVEICAHLDGLFVPPPQVHVTGEGAALLIAENAAEAPAIAVDARVRVIKDEIDGEPDFPGRVKQVGREGVVRIIQQPGDWPSVSVLLDGDEVTSMWREDELEVIAAVAS
jgi:hypothetical protein